MSVNIYDKLNDTLKEVAGKPSNMIPVINWGSQITISDSNAGSWTATQDCYIDFLITSTTPSIANYGIFINGNSVTSYDTSEGITVYSLHTFIKKGDVITQASEHLNNTAIFRAFPVTWVYGVDNPVNIISDNTTSEGTTWSSSAISDALANYTRTKLAEGLYIYKHQKHRVLVGEGASPVQNGSFTSLGESLNENVRTIGYMTSGSNYYTTIIVATASGALSGTWFDPTSVTTGAIGIGTYNFFSLSYYVK